MSARAKGISQADLYRFHSQADIAEMFGFGRETLRALVALGAPVVARKMNPHLLLKWLEANPEKLAEMEKIRPERADD